MPNGTDEPGNDRGMRLRGDAHENTTTIGFIPASLYKPHLLQSRQPSQRRCCGPPGSNARTGNRYLLASLLGYKQVQQHVPRRFAKQSFRKKTAPRAPGFQHFTRKRRYFGLHAPSPRHSNISIIKLSITLVITQISRFACYIEVQFFWLRLHTHARPIISPRQAGHRNTIKPSTIKWYFCTNSTQYSMSLLGITEPSNIHFIQNIAGCNKNRSTQDGKIYIFHLSLTNLLNINNRLTTQSNFISSHLHGILIQNEYNKAGSKPGCRPNHALKTTFRDAPCFDGTGKSAMRSAWNAHPSPPLHSRPSRQSPA